MFIVRWSASDNVGLKTEMYAERFLAQLKRRLLLVFAIVGGAARHRVAGELASAAAPGPRPGMEGAAHRQHRAHRAPGPAGDHPRARTRPHHG